MYRDSGIEFRCITQPSVDQLCCKSNITWKSLKGQPNPFLQLQGFPVYEHARRNRTLSADQPGETTLATGKRKIAKTTLLDREDERDTQLTVKQPARGRGRLLRAGTAVPRRDGERGGSDPPSTQRPAEPSRAAAWGRTEGCTAHPKS